MSAIHFIVPLDPTVHSADPMEVIQDVVTACVHRITVPFYSVDVARRRDGELRIVEVGDGQYRISWAGHPTDSPTVGASMLHRVKPGSRVCPR
jgi:hypothetical protein